MALTEKKKLNLLIYVAGGAFLIASMVTAYQCATKDAPTEEAPVEEAG